MGIINNQYVLKSLLPNDAIGFIGNPELIQ